ncbi:CAP domain-containing protein [Tropicimonas sp.]|uniref:CAP domain-containing protein n=1 Tax=Tropicimonas sp. TaxID=2067044 RepID=UPI003A847A8A
MSSSLTAAEQYLIELINRARLDPLGEAARYGIRLNDDLPAGTLSGGSRQVLAPNSALAEAATNHSKWMLDNDVFSHTGAGGSRSYQRMDSAGYDFTGAWSAGENISVRGSTGSISLNGAIESHHRGLFLSAGHRVNILRDNFQEIGIGQVAGKFEQDGKTYNSSMLTENFARSGNSVFLTGVVYDDLNNNRFYTIGEGRSGTVFSANGQSTKSMSAGGYALELTAADWVDVAVRRGDMSAAARVDMSSGNVKLDLVGTTWLEASADLDLKSGIANARLLGADDLSLSGNGAANRLVGNEGGNRIDGLGGNDTLYGKGGRDRLVGGDGNDSLNGGGGGDKLFGQGGNDRLYGGSGHDRLSGGGGQDRLVGGSGDDLLLGGSGSDKLFGQGGNDRLYGGSGYDRLWGDSGRDRLVGGDGNDVLLGGSGNDKLFGQGNDDRLYGGSGNDRLSGGSGNDRLCGESGNDVLMGGTGRDTFVFKGNFGSDHIRDFSASDTLLFIPVKGEASDFGAFRSASRQIGDDVVYDMDRDGRNVITFDDIRLGELSGDNFVFT